MMSIVVVLSEGINFSPVLYEFNNDKELIPYKWTANLGLDLVKVNQI